MRVLLDECFPKRLRRELVGHDARTAPEMGWVSKRNGELLALAVGQFEIFLTADRNLSYQQDCSAFDMQLWCSSRPAIVSATCVCWCLDFSEFFRLLLVAP